jgi:hypothetical protein
VGISSTPTGALRGRTLAAITGLQTCSGTDPGMKSGTDMLLIVMVIGTRSLRCGPKNASNDGVSS